MRRVITVGTHTDRATIAIKARVDSPRLELTRDELESVVALLADRLMMAVVDLPRLHSPLSRVTVKY